MKTSEAPIVFVVDDDYRVREALSSLISSVGLRVAAFGSAVASEITIGVHRGQIMPKMGARSLAELVRMADKLGITR